MQRKGFIFDLDGVIVDTAKYHFLAWNKLAKTINISFTEEENEQLKGVSRVRSLEKILAWGNTEVSQDKFNELLIRKNDDYLTYIASMDSEEILPDVPRILNYLKEERQPIGLGSASKNARNILKKVGLFNDFHCVVDGTNVTKAKPDPEVFLMAADGLNMAAADCIVFEDSLAGVEAANIAGMVSIGIGEASVLHEANFVFTDFRQITNQFLQQLIKK